MYSFVRLVYCIIALLAVLQKNSSHWLLSTFVVVHLEQLIQCGCVRAITFELSDL